MRHGLALHFVMDHKCRERLHWRGAHRVKTGEAVIPQPEEAQHRHHAVDGRQQLGWRRLITGDKALPQGQQIEQQLDQHCGIAADMPAIGQDLPPQLVRQRLGAGERRGLLFIGAQAGEGKRDQSYQPWQPVIGVAVTGFQIAELKREAAHQGLVKFYIRAFQEDGGVGQPGNDAPCGDFRLPCEPARLTMKRDPVAHQCAGMLAGNLVMGGVQMAQPAETVKLALPRLARRRYGEWRVRAGQGNHTGQPEMTMIDFAGETGIAGAQILRRQQQAVDRLAAITPAQQARAQQFSPGQPPGAVCRRGGQTGAV
ncbi:MAG: hypothetical protein IIB62_11075 [Proteobacteria bacterium]|nr:hypothetical protein [Pseudomonadota bacterium]